HRPVLHGDPAIEHRATDESLGHRVWISLADERRDQTLDQATDDERGPRRAEAGATDRPARPTPPPLAHQLTHQRVGSAVGRAEKDRLPRRGQAAYRLVESRDLVRALGGRDGEAATDDVGVVGVHHYPIALWYTGERPRASIVSEGRRSAS